MSSGRDIRRDGYVIVGKAVAIARRTDLAPFDVWYVPQKGRIVAGCSSYPATGTFKRLAEALGYEVTG